MPEHNENYDKKQWLVPFLSLFTSFGTLLCCALPALLVSIGAGAALAGVLSTFPELAIISKHKDMVFTIAALMLFFSGVMIFRARNLPCPADKQKAEACSRARKISKYIYIFSLLIFLVGLFFAYFAVYLI